MRHLDLFSGLGVFTTAAQKHGWQTIAFAETDRYASAVLAHRFPDIPNLGDVRKLCRRVYDCDPIDEETGEARCPRCGVDFGECACIGADQFLDEYGSPDIVTGGFPCVDITHAKHAVDTPAGIDGDHSGLWREMWRICRELEPRWIVVENAAALTFRGLGDVLGDLARGGYDALWFRLSAARLGAPHRRLRTFIVAHAHEPGLERNVCEELAGAIQRRSDPDLGRSTWWDSEPGIRRVDDGTACRRQRLTALGNSVVLPVAEFILGAIHEIDTAALTS